MRYAVISGGTRGIGRAIAEKFLAEGFSVAVCARNKEHLEACKKEWGGKYPEATVIAYSADLSNAEEAAGFASAVMAAFPSIDILVNNTGTYFPGNIAGEPEGQLEQMMGINLYSAYYLTRHILPVMKEKAAGHVFNICSIASLKAYPNGGSYGISKYALMGFSENLRVELMPDNIKVTAICPGATYTDSWVGSGVAPERMMEANDIAVALWAAYSLSAGANLETIVLRPLKGDL